MTYSKSPDLQSLSAIPFDDYLAKTASVSEFVSRILIGLEKKQLLTQLDEQLKEETKRDIAITQREEFLSICAHDLRSPLGLISSSLSLLLNNKNELSPFVTELLTRAQRQSANAIVLVNDLLDVMSYEQGLKPKYDLIVLDGFLSEFYQDYKLQAEEKNIKFHYENPVRQWRVLLDTDRIRQLFAQNLFTNAVKFTDPNKNIFLKVTPFFGRRAKDPPYPMVKISIRDEGPGIPKNEIQKIFDRFSQLKDQSRAQGRGLVCRSPKRFQSTTAETFGWIASPIRVRPFTSYCLTSSVSLWNFLHEMETSFKSWSQKPMKTNEMSISTY